jgi:diguanylate cyclase (GGDEF)-like protein
VVAFSNVDIDMEEIRARQRSFTLMTFAILFALAVVVCIIGFIIVNRAVVAPIRRLTDTASNYIKEENESGTHHGFADLKIASNDEIGELANSMKQMESDINDYYTTLFAAKQEIISTREEANRMSEAANRDALTGVRNKRAYDNMLADIDQEIKAGGAVFGIAMVDLNYLKTINDEYGHDKGNIAIKKLCRLICVTFSHSPVFRIGGDEFAIILKNSDYENIQELVAKFEQELAKDNLNSELPPWEKTSAALGYTFYQPEEDKDADTVFRRADSLMYERKREMKKQ